MIIVSGFGKRGLPSVVFRLLRTSNLTYDEVRSLWMFSVAALMSRNSMLRLKYRIVVGCYQRIVRLLTSKASASCK